MICPNCGTEVNEGLAFCNKCGRPLVKTYNNSPDSLLPENIRKLLPIAVAAAVIIVIIAAIVSVKKSNPVKATHSTQNDYDTTYDDTDSLDNNTESQTNPYEMMIGDWGRTSDQIFFSITESGIKYDGIIKYEELEFSPGFCSKNDIIIEDNNNAYDVIDKVNGLKMEYHPEDEPYGMIRLYVYYDNQWNIKKDIYRTQ